MNGTAEPGVALKTYYTWLLNNWQMSGVLIAVYLSAYLTVQILPKDPLQYAMLMAFPLYIAHEFEEYVFPGGFPEFFNKKIYLVDDPDLVPFDNTSIFWINALYVWIPLPLFSLLSCYNLNFGMWIPYMFIFQAFVHILLGIKGRQFLNPGMYTAWLLHVPYALWMILKLHQQGYLGNVLVNSHLLVGLMVNLSLPLVGFGPFPFSLKNRYRRKLAAAKGRAAPAA